MSESLEYVEILKHNNSGNWLAEEVALENFPLTTVFGIRLLAADGRVIYAASQPNPMGFPGGWTTRLAKGPLPVLGDGWEEVFISGAERYAQVKTTHLPDGRVLQVAKATDREHVLNAILFRTLLIFVGLGTGLSLSGGLWMMALTLRPINRVIADMSRVIKTGEPESGISGVSSRISELNTLGTMFGQMLQKNALLIRAMKDTLDNVAHDFRTPLARIRSAAETALSSRRQPPDINALIGALAVIIEDCDNAKLQLQNLMDLRAMESGLIQLDRQRFDLAKTVAQVADFYAVLADEKNITMRIALPDGEVPVDGNADRLSQVVANLIDNAIKYTPRDGDISIALESAADKVILTVADNGIGIPADEQALVWQRLFRGSNARSEKGLGLGMSVIKSIVEAHGGTVSLTSEQGHGSRFVFSLPVY